jgi:hypothetical protein
MNINSLAQPEAVKELELLNKRFESITNEAKDISDTLYEKANRLSSFSLICDQEKSAMSDVPDGIVKTLNDLADKLSFINRRNTEIYQHLNKLI